MFRHTLTVQARSTHEILVALAMAFLLHLMGCALDTSGETSGSKPGIDPSMPFECSGSFLSQYPETCNGLDDDCDGVIDEGVTGCPVAQDELPFRLCSSSCCISDLACPAEQVCHRLGEQGRCGAPCQDGEFRLCSFGCAPEFQECVAGFWAACASLRPQAERCNEKDDDCDGVIDENIDCTSDNRDAYMDDAGIDDSGISNREDSSFIADMGVTDMDVESIADVGPDAAMPVDSGTPPVEPECTRHAQCEPYTLCLNRQCQVALPGRFNIILVSARVDEDIGDSFSFGFGGEPDLFADIRMGDTVLGSPSPVEENVYSAVWNHRVTLELSTQQTFSACVWDDDGGLRGDDDLAGCASLTSDGLVEQIRTFQGTRMRANWASVRPQITSGQHVEDFLIHVDRF